MIHQRLSTDSLRVRFPAGCDDVVGPEGMEKFCEDIGVEPENVRECTPRSSVPQCQECPSVAFLLLWDWLMMMSLLCDWLVMMSLVCDWLCRW